MSEQDKNNNLSLKARVYKLLDENPKLTSKKLAELTGTKEGACSYHKTVWKRARGVAVERRRKNGNHNSEVTTILPATSPGDSHEEEKVSEPPSEQTQSASNLPAYEVACELLKQTVKSINDYADILADRNYWRTYAKSMEAQVTKAEEERDRIKQIHNTMVEFANNGRIPTLEEVVRTIRRKEVQPVPRIGK